MIFYFLYFSKLLWLQVFTSACKSAVVFPVGGVPVLFLDNKKPLLWASRNNPYRYISCANGRTKAMLYFLINVLRILRFSPLSLILAILPLNGSRTKRVTQAACFAWSTLTCFPCHGGKPPNYFLKGLGLKPYWPIVSKVCLSIREKHTKNYLGNTQVVFRDINLRNMPPNSELALISFLSMANKPTQKWKLNPFLTT